MTTTRTPESKTPHLFQLTVYNSTYQGCEHLLDMCALRLKLRGVIVVDLLKRLAAVSKVAGVDADLQAAKQHPEPVMCMQ
jgi:hypothetical protein